METGKLLLSGGDTLPADQVAVRATSTRVCGTGATGRRRSCVAPGYGGRGGGSEVGWAVLIFTQKPGMLPWRGEAATRVRGCGKDAEFTPLLALG